MSIRCLIVDDNEQFLRTARTLLEREGINVVAVATTGAEAVQRAGEFKPDLVLVDIALGKEDGFAVAQRLTADSAQQLNVIMISSYDPADFNNMISGTTALGFLPKSDLSGAAIHQLIETGQ